MTYYSRLPCSSYDPAPDADRLAPTLPAIIARRGRHAVAATQADAFFMFGLAVLTDADLRAEAERARAGEQAPIVRDKTSIVRACVAGAIRPDEAVTLFKRAQS